VSSDFEGQSVIVTGAAKGIGLAVARKFKALGATVSGWDIDIGPIREDGTFHHTATVDVADEDSVERAFEESREALGKITVLVANAGVNGVTKSAWDYSLDEWNQVLKVDLTGVFLSTRAVLDHMRAAGYGRIVVMASVAGKEGNTSACAYGAAKAGVIGYAKGLARELQPSNITVNCIAPAITETDLFHEMDEAYISARRALIPMGRFCTVEEIADMTAWVASPQCSFTTGQVFDVTGGRATY